MMKHNELFEKLQTMSEALNNYHHSIGDVSLILIVWDHSTGDVSNFLYGNLMMHTILISQAISKMADGSDGKVSTDTICDIIKYMCRHQEDFKDEYKGD